MIKSTKLGKYCTVRLPDTFLPSTLDTNKGDNKVNIHFGGNMDIVVVTARDKQLSKDDQERIRILTEVRH